MGKSKGLDPRDLDRVQKMLEDHRTFWNEEYDEEEEKGRY